MNTQKQNAEKIWEKGIPVDELIEQFTIGKDRDLDLYLAPFDVMGSVAHVKMLHSIGLIAEEELPGLVDELKKIYEKTLAGTFFIEDGIEDVHSQVELMLTRALGDVGKKVHSGRSRNDQVLLDLKLYARNEIQQLVELTNNLFKLL